VPGFASVPCGPPEKKFGNAYRCDTPKQPLTTDGKGVKNGHSRADRRLSAYSVEKLIFW
jgi:hypothetical protein